MKSKAYMNPYLAGIILGLVLLGTIYITGRGLGASGAVKSVALSTITELAPEHTENTTYLKEYAENYDGPLKNWLVWEVIGVVIGAFFSGVLSNRVGLQLERGAKVSEITRIGTAILGGLLFGLGSQLGRGCTSGSALSGMAVMSFGGIITMMAIFGSAYAFAYFFRNLWLK
ncbi:YeeE/YedE family protein [Lutibacter sp. A80]|uniref:YeeE/YedE thiosulfate transporter family protein n=1 Tax=Lutibacter sp. A80 TaxID=2918453 RepID=UPI001F05A6CA|nr:YeeE/YedE thiosulfate transporter family protein [Lutibacter sp. A80]UMB60938.1 YeeE/YedE family protein [Lutibacter sp. A80]